VFPDQRFRRSNLAVVQAIILRQLNLRLKPEFASPPAWFTWTWSRDSSREKKKNRNPFSRKIVGLKGYSSGT